MTARRSLRAGLRGASCNHNDMSSRAARLPWHWAAALSVALAVVLAGAAGHRPARAGSASPPAAAVPPLALTDRSAKILGVVPGDRVELSASAAGPWRTFRVAGKRQRALRDDSDGEPEAAQHLPEARHEPPREHGHVQQPRSVMIASRNTLLARIVTTLIAR